jgi:hypothetical protein
MRLQLKRFIGERIGGEPDAGEFGHFYLCRACQQPVDKRDLAAVTEKAPGCVTGLCPTRGGGGCLSVSPPEFRPPLSCSQ